MTDVSNPKTLAELQTPAVILDLGVLSRNTSRMGRRMKSLGMNLRPHLKTAKSIDVARLATEGHFGGVTVSTLREVEHFIDHGVLDVTYAVGISPDKLDAVIALQQKGGRVNILTDDVGVAKAIAAKVEATGEPLSVMIDVDIGYGRSGVKPESEELLAIGRQLQSAEVNVQGVLTHAGHSYDAEGPEAIKRIAEEERAGMVRAAERLREAGIPCPVVSVGSTPTAVLAEHLDGVTEVRPGNYVFFDMSMYGRGVCAIEDIAVSVLTTVIVSRPETGRVLVDAGALALSKDLGVTPHPTYGTLRDIRNEALTEEVVINRVCQEQGWLGIGDKTPVDASQYPVGRRLRVLPNHSCMTCAAYDRYYVVNGDDTIIDVWERCGGW